MSQEIWRASSGFLRHMNIKIRKRLSVINGILNVFYFGAVLSSDERLPTGFH